jgi:hypothetical protein
MMVTEQQCASQLLLFLTLSVRDPAYLRKQRLPETAVLARKATGRPIYESGNEVVECDWEGEGEHHACCANNREMWLRVLGLSINAGPE